MNSGTVPSSEGRSSTSSHISIDSSDKNVVNASSWSEKLIKKQKLNFLRKLQ